MKLNIVAALLLFFSTLQIAYAQDDIFPLDPTTNKVSYSAIINAPGKSAHDLYGKARKWFASKTSGVNRYSISYASDTDGTVIGTGTFILPETRKKYIAKFIINIKTKDDKCKFECSDIRLQYTTPTTSRSGYFGGFSGSSVHNSEVLEYSLETFYPARLHSRKPVVRQFEEIDKDAFTNINKEMVEIASSLKETLRSNDDW